MDVHPRTVILPWGSVDVHPRTAMDLPCQRYHRKSTPGPTVLIAAAAPLFLRPMMMTLSHCPTRRIRSYVNFLISFSVRGVALADLTLHHPSLLAADEGLVLLALRRCWTSWMGVMNVPKLVLTVQRMFLHRLLPANRYISKRIRLLFRSWASLRPTATSESDRYPTCGEDSFAQYRRDAPSIMVGGC